VIGVAAVAAVASDEHAYALVRAHGEVGWTTRLVPLTVAGLIYANSIVVLDSARSKETVPGLARWLLGFGVADAEPDSAEARMFGPDAGNAERGWRRRVVASQPAINLVLRTKLIGSRKNSFGARAGHVAVWETDRVATRIDAVPLVTSRAGSLHGVLDAGLN
jgi:hypothetical protein